MATYHLGIDDDRLFTLALLANRGIESAERGVSAFVALAVGLVVGLGLRVLRRRFGWGSALIVVLIALVTYMCVLSDLYIGYQ